MTRGVARGIAAVAAAMASGILPAWSADLALQRVALSTGGVGYFEYAATVSGDAALALDVPLDQVDDVLKSLVVYDPAGAAGEITLPGREPLQHSLADLPFDRAALQSEVALLNALQGAEIRVAAPKAISGRLVHAEDVAAEGPDRIARHRTRVSVMTDAGLQQFAVEDVDAIAFADPQLQRQVETALQRIAAARDAGRRRLMLQLHGSGSRPVRVGYVVAAPLWKASYRLSLAADSAAKTARLQGWAVLENLSGQAWQDVELTLVSGNPVTFRQPLYESYYVPRPVVPVEAGGHVLPPPDTGTVAAEAAKMAPQAPRGRTVQAAPPAAPPPARLEPAAASEQVTQVAFTPAHKVTVAAGQSLVLPLLDRDLPARRVDLYQPSLDAQHPLAAIELTNDGDSGLPAGALTLYQRNADNGAAYVGDARLALLPHGEQRLLSYAVDGRVTLDRSASEQRPVVRGTISQGVLRLTRALRWITEYRIKSAMAAAPILIIEQPRHPGARLTAPNPGGVELTPGAYRIPVAMPAAGEAHLSVVEEQPSEETFRLLDIADDRLVALVASGELSPGLHQTLTELAARRQGVARQRAELQRLKDQRSRLLEDEKRLRDNLAVLGGDPELHKRVLDQFAETETAITTSAAAIEKASDALGAAERSLAAYVSGLTL